MTEIFRPEYPEGYRPRPRLDIGSWDEPGRDTETAGWLESEPEYGSPWAEPLDDEDVRLRARIEELLDLLEGRMGKDRREDGYEFFPGWQDREELFRYCAELTEYLHDNAIADLVIVDRSSRPMWIGVKEYWKAKYPDEKMPGIYFLNPKGFKTVENTSYDVYLDTVDASAWKDDRPEFGEMRTDEEVKEELEQVYARLMEDKDKPVMLFDACLHSGRTLKPVVDIMREVGFSQLQIGVVSSEDVRFDAELQPDFALTEDFPAKGCYPFDRDRMIEKTFNHVYSLPTEDRRKVETSARLRHEIRRIMRDRLGAGREDVTIDLRDTY